jgi:hypothetical protein
MWLLVAFERTKTGYRELTLDPIHLAEIAAKNSTALLS